MKMLRQLVRSLLLPAVALLLMHTPAALAQGTAFTYQGRLNDGAALANGYYDLRFSVYDAASGGTQIATLSTSAITISNGLFTVALDFGSAPFTAGRTRWLEIAARTNGSGSFTTLANRQQLTPTPFALFAPNAAVANSANAVAAANITGTLALTQLPGAVVTNNASGVNLSGTFSGNAGGLTNVPGTTPWQTVAGASQTGLPNQAYLLTNNALSTFTLPASANPGDVVTVSGAGSNGWQVLPATGQTLVGCSVAGVNWVAQNSAFQNWTCVASSADGTKLVAAGNQGPIYSSSNSGVTWTAQNSGSMNWHCLASSADGIKLVAVGSSGANFVIFTSSDSGVTWAMQNASTLPWKSVASSADGTKLVLVSTSGQIETSSNSGTNWTARAIGSQYWYSVASSGDGTKLVAVAGSGQIDISSNSGVTWTEPYNGSAFWSSVASSADGTKLVAVASPGQIYTSSDSGVTWTAQASGTQSWQGVASSSDGTKLVAVASGGPIYTSSDSGVTWTAQPSGSRSWQVVASSSDGSKLVAAVSPGQIYTSAQTIFPSGTAAQFQYVGNGTWQSLNQSASQLTGTLSAANLPGQVMTRDSNGGFTSSGAAFGDFHSPLALIQNNNNSGNSAPSLRLVGYGASPSGVLSVSSQGTGLLAQFGNASAFVADITTNGTVDAAAFNGSGTGLTSLDASQLSAGTLPDARLSSNVPRLNTAQTFTARNTFNQGLSIGTASSLEGDVLVNTNTYLFSHAIYLRGEQGTDHNHGLAYNGNGITNFGTGNVQVDGPVLWGFAGGALGVMSGGAHSVLSWTNGGVSVPGNLYANGVQLTSDRSAKEHFTGVNAKAVLEKVASLPLSQWNYKSDSASTHLGPMAQDFHAAFGLNGADDKHISVVDENGVALAAIQGLNQKLKEKDVEIRELRQRLDALEHLLRKQATR